VESAGGATCPLCGGAAQASEGVVEAEIALLSCGHCRAFVMEKRLIDVVMNARAWNLRPVLRHIAFLSRAAQRPPRTEPCSPSPRRTGFGWPTSSNGSTPGPPAETLAEVTYRS
jgi:hypothetical protein